MSESELEVLLQKVERLTKVLGPLYGIVRAIIIGSVAAVLWGVDTRAEITSLKLQVQNQAVELQQAKLDHEELIGIRRDVGTLIKEVPAISDDLKKLTYYIIQEEKRK